MIKNIISALFTFKGLYVVFVIAIVIYGNYHWPGGITPRQVASLAMFAACLKKETAIVHNNVLGLYVLFVFSFGVSSFVTGYEIRYLTFLFSNYMVSFIAIWATKILITKYDCKDVFINLFIILGVLDGVITICQTFGFALGDNLVSFFHLHSSKVFMEELNPKRAEALDYFDTYDTMSDFSDIATKPKKGITLMEFVIPGAFNSGVYNGYFLLTTGIMSLRLLQQKLAFSRIIPWIIITIACICVQERGPIILLLALSFYAFYKILKSHHIKKRSLSVLFITVALITIIRAVYNFVSQIGSRIVNIGLEDKGRESIYDDSFNYYLDNPVFGGYFRFTDNFDTAPHNLILNAFIYGGVIGGLAIVILLFVQFKPIIKTLWNNISKKNEYCFFIALAYTAFTLNSFLHNRSVVTGDVIVWMLWAAFYFDYKKQNQVTNK